MVMVYASALLFAILLLTFLYFDTRRPSKKEDVI